MMGRRGFRVEQLKIQTSDYLAYCVLAKKSGSCGFSHSFLCAPHNHASWQVNKPESASSLLDKAGKMIEKERPGDATGLYEKAAVTVSTEDRSDELSPSRGF